jgi:creatinine amidohydrolase
MLFDQLNWIGIEEYLARDDRIVVIAGACEQHGYSAVTADVLEPLELAKAATQIDPVLIAPPIAYGISPSFIAYPGTISLRVETFATVAREVLESLVRQGFRRVLVSNGHGGNTGVLTPLLVELANAHPAARFELFQWWTHPDVVKVGESFGLVQSHANWSENFKFTRIGPAPDGGKAPPVITRTASAAEVRARLGDGSYGGAYQASDEAMAAFFQAAVDAMVAALGELKRR